MEQRILGRTGRAVSVIGLGTWQLGADWGEVVDKDALAVLDAAAESGITLLDTAEAFVNNSPSGYFVAELNDVLHVSVQDPLLLLVSRRRIARQLLSGVYLYCSADAATRQRQLRARQQRPDTPSVSDSVIGADSVSDELKAGIVLFYSLLDERQRRLYAGLEALKLGRGGDRRISELLGLDPHTVAKGRRELYSQDVQPERVRKAGAGRHPTEKKLPK